jgi:cytosine/adenosine deaminase-related metal-dependent hydrolase
VDLGAVVLLPGLINAHCHLDYTDMADQLSPPRSFSDWIKGILALKAHWSYSDYALSWLHGAEMLLRHGITTVADVEAVPELLPETLCATPLRVCSLLELTAVRRRRPAAEIMRQAVNKIESLPLEKRWAGLSPHALYSTTPELLRLSGELSRQRHWLLATHLSESAEEFEMFTEASGPMHAWLQKQRDMSDCGRGSPVQCLDREGVLGPNLLAVHVNYLAPGDASLLGQRQVNVVHCPRSHAYFGHRPFPHEDLAKAGVNICLGTDSLASIRSRAGRPATLDLFAEMRQMGQVDQDLSPAALLELVTLNAAKAVGMASRLGELSAGAAADLITLPFTRSVRQAYDAVVNYSGAVTGVMIKGQWVTPRPP